MSVWLCLSVFLCLCVFLSVSISLCPSVCLSVYLFVCVCVCLSTCLPVYLLELSIILFLNYLTIWVKIYNRRLSGFKFVSNLAGTQSHNQISDKCIFCFSTAVTDHHTPAAILSQLTPEEKKENQKQRTSNVSTFVELSLPFTITLGFNWQSHQATRRTVMAPTSLTVFPDSLPFHCPPHSHITHPSFKYYYI